MSERKHRSLMSRDASGPLTAGSYIRFYNLGRDRYLSKGFEYVEEWWKSQIDPDTGSRDLIWRIEHADWHPGQISDQDAVIFWTAGSPGDFFPLECAPINLYSANKANKTHRVHRICKDDLTSGPDIHFGDPFFLRFHTQDCNGRSWWGSNEKNGMVVPIPVVQQWRDLWIAQQTAAPEPR